jgi:hypothetical protein
LEEKVAAPVSLVSTIEELVGRKCSGSGLQKREYTLTTWHLVSVKVRTKFTDKRRSLGRYSFFTYSVHGVFFIPFRLQSVLGHSANCVNRGNVA